MFVINSENRAARQGVEPDAHTYSVGARPAVPGSRYIPDLWGTHGSGGNKCKRAITLVGVSLSGSKGYFGAFTLRAAGQLRTAPLSPKPESAICLCIVLFSGATFS